MMSSHSTMKYRDYCLQHKIPFFPLRLWIHPKWIDGNKSKGVDVELLSDGSQKQTKQICGDKFKSKADIIKFYGEELGNWVIENNTKPTGKAVYKWNVIPTFNDFNLPKRLIKKYMKARWYNWNHGNSMKYTHFAVDTRCIGIIDIDCELDEDSPIHDLKSKLPFKCSNTKAFGGHLIFNREDIPFPEDRTSKHLPKKYGKCWSKTRNQNVEGVELLQGIWEWSKIDDDICFPQDCEENNALVSLDQVPVLKQILLKLTEINNNIISSNMNQGETKTQREPTTTPPPAPLPVSVGVPVRPVGVCDCGKNCPLTIIRENLAHYKVEALANAQTAGGMVKACASSACEAVYDIVLDCCMREGANFSNEGWVRQRWDSYNIISHASYKHTYDTKYSVPFVPKFDWFKFNRDPEKIVKERFLKNHRNDFIINTDYKREQAQLCYFESIHQLWKHDPKVGIGKSVIHHLLMKEREYWEVEMEASIEAMDAPTQDAAGVTIPNPKAEEATKTMISHLRKYNSTGGWLPGMVRNIYNELLYDYKLRKVVQFNLMPHTTHLFQFNNGAYNLKTGKLTPRTRDMYITDSGILNYDYPTEYEDAEIEAHLKPKTDILEKMIREIIPNKRDRDAWCSWKGYCLTGDILGQMMMLYLGASAGNGKSTLTEMFANAFPCYCKKIGMDAVCDKTKDDKSLGRLVNTSYRSVYVEEIEEIGLKIKQLTQDLVPVKPLYMEEMDLNVMFKLEANCNKVPICKTDEGVLRRMRQIECNSIFVDDEDDVELENHKYLKNPSLGNMFKQDQEMKIALFRYFAKHAKAYYDMGVNTFQKQFDGMAEAFKETNQDDDTMAEFLGLFVEDVDDEATISKTQMLQYLFNETGDEFVKTNANGIQYKKFSLIRNEFKRKRFKYESQMRISGQKGFFTNIKFIGDETNDDE